jgi:hypothetical protein
VHLRDAIPQKVIDTPENGSGMTGRSSAIGVEQRGAAAV